MEQMMKEVSDKEDELKSLACELSELLKEYERKEIILEQASKMIPVLEKKLKRKGEMVEQELQDNEIILARIEELEREKIKGEKE
jgi:hypothetical protein